MEEKSFIDPFLDRIGPLFDVRSPGEYAKGHIPGALSLPLFTDEERKIVGTLYKQVSPEEAYLKGLDLVAPKLSEFARVALKHRGESLRIYCWRGGSRSGSMAWLFSLVGAKVETLKGGYKTFRRSVTGLERLFKKKNFSFLTLGGWTGSGKSDLLREQKVTSILDLEALANHRGSIFGEVAGLSQPTQEHFENLIFKALNEIPENSTLLIEDESRLIGKLQVPISLFTRMQKAPLLFLNRSKEERVPYLIKNYTPLDPSSIKKIEKRLGGERTKKVETLLLNGNSEEAASILIDYYDAAYAYSLKRSSREHLKQEFSTKEDLLNTLKELLRGIY